MKTKNFGIIAIMAVGVLALSGCGKTEAPVEENVEIANPASVYCEENGGTLNLEEGLCMFADGSYCEEWSYFRDECQPGEIMYNTVDEEITVEPATASQTYSEEDLAAVETAIRNVIDNEWQVRVESVELAYAGDEKSASNLEYCQSLNSEISECAVFTSSFHIPEQNTIMAGAFEPNTDISGWSWFVGKDAAGEWKVLSDGF